jgi:hypothetical protein
VEHASNSCLASPCLNLRCLTLEEDIHGGSQLIYHVLELVIGLGLLLAQTVQVNLYRMIICVHLLCWFLQRFKLVPGVEDSIGIMLFEKRKHRDVFPNLGATGGFMRLSLCGHVVEKLFYTLSKAVSLF